MKKIGLVIVASILLSGCANQIALTDQESNEIAEYVASTMLKYDKNYQESLISSSNVSLTNDSSEETDSVVDNSGSEVSQTDQTNSDQNNGDQTTEVTTNNVDSSTGDSTGDVSEPLALQNSLGFSDVTIDYIGAELVSTYPPEDQRMAENDYYAVNATDGHALLVLSFDLNNTSADLAVADVLSISPKFTAVINESDNYSAMTTLVLNDLSTCYEEMQPGESKSMVLIFEVPADLTIDQISSISLTVNTSDTTTTHILQ